MKIITTQPHINSVLDLVFVLLFTLFSITIIWKLKKLLKYKSNFIFVVFSFLHLFFTLFYYFKTKVNVSGDSAHYYMRIIAPENYLNPTIKFGFSSSFIKSIVYFFHHTFNFSYLSFFFLFSSIGILGYYYFIKSLVELGVKKNLKYLGVSIVPLVLLLPNQHNWTVALGKDSLMFFGLMMLTYATINFRKRKLLFLLSSFLVCMTRPHVFLMVVTAIVLSTIWSNEIKWLKKIVLASIFLFVGYLLFYIIATNVLRIEPTINALNAFIEKREGIYVKMDYSGSLVDTSSYPFIFKVFSYLFRPLFEKLNFNYIIIGLDNLLSLFILSILFCRGFISWLNKSSFSTKFSFIFALIGILFFSSIFSNFGIAVRQKTQFVFSLYLVAFLFLSERKNMIRFRKKNIRIVAP